MLLRFDPFRELDRLTEQVDRMAGATVPAVPMDAVKVGDHVEVAFDLPGFDPASIDLEVDRNVLTLSAERNWQAPEGAQLIARERRYGKITRQLLLGDTLDGTAVEAHYDNGVLRVLIPVAEAAKPRKVAINASGNGNPTAIPAQSTSN